MAPYVSLLYVCGAAFGPLLTGRLSDHLASRLARAAGSVVNETFRAAGMQQAMLVIPILSLAMAIALWAGARSSSPLKRA